jgi:hypothetical protein
MMKMMKIELTNNCPDDDEQMTSSSRDLFLFSPFPLSLYIVNFNKFNILLVTFVIFLLLPVWQCLTPFGVFPHQVELTQ